MISFFNLNKKSYFILILLILLFVSKFFAQQISTRELYESPKKYTIGGIEIEGTENTDKNVLKYLTGLFVGDEIQIPGEKISDAIKNLMKQGMFDDVKIYVDKILENDIFLRIVVQEKPRLSKFTFIGKIKKSEADDIREKIRLIREKVITDYTIGNIKNTIKEYYVNKGYYFTEVEITQEPDKLAKTPHIILYIKIKKGKKVRVKDINFYGNTVLSSGKLRRTMKETKRKRWWNPFNSGKYLEENLEKDLPNIIEKYNARGYRDARIVKDTVYFVEPYKVNIDIHLDEGHKYYFGKFYWYGNSKYRSGQLDTILNIKEGEVFNQQKLDQKLFMNPNGYDISSLYMDDGYLFFQVQPKERQIRNDTIDFDIHIYEGKQAIINKVSVKGNDKTNDKVIYREMRTRPGQLFRRSDIIRTQRELAQLGYFDPEKFGVNPVPNPAEGTVDLEYTLEEKPNDQLQLSGGWGGGRVLGTLGVVFNNFSAKNFFKKDAWTPLPSGDGQRLSIQAQTNGTFYQSYNISFTEPWLGGKRPNSLTGTVFFTSFAPLGVKKTMKVDGKKVTNPNAQFMDIIGSSIGFGKRLKWPDDYFQIYTSANYNYYRLNKYSLFQGLSSGFANDFHFSFNISRNSIDAPIFPKNGSNISITGQWTPPYSLFIFKNRNISDLSNQEKYKFIEYQKYKFTAEWFTQITNKKAAEGKEARNLVLRLKMGWGFLAYYNKNIGFSPFERFYLGGSGLSGFQNFVSREIIALRGYPDNSLSDSYGSPIVTRYTAELRYPLTLNPQATIFVLGFAEAGNAFSKFKYFSPFDVKRSAGIGVRIFLPMFGLLGLDYGWGFDNVHGNPGIGNGKGQFHFTIGGFLGEL
ncbi:MAG TPA: outer membrane protein assembly factor BamA [Bacteroidia bacterium]|nr:outer membrane protein assembly factor BamA [Bacteroidia bacterium]